MILQETNPNKPIVTWLGIGVGMLMIQILLGGITRLTGSGLSITEWDPVIGAIPPLNAAAWKKSFELYQHIAQFKRVNSGFSLADYKSIFFWEWLHREWARLMGLVFIIPFLVFMIRGKIGKELIKPLVFLFALGGLQGAIGWIMGESGLNDTDTRVSHIRLAVHFLFAMLLLSYLLWFILKLSVKNERCAELPKLRKLNLLILILLAVQLLYGAFMAGTHAALFAPTWPDMNGTFLPGLNFNRDAVLHSLWYNPFVIQFIHRSLAYLIAITIFMWYLKARRISKTAALNGWRAVPMLLVLTQVTLGIFALINSGSKAAVSLSVAHQFTGMLLLLCLVVTLYLSKNRKMYRSPGH